MEKGYNSDVLIKGTTFHVQTEDWGKNNPFIVTHVFKDGAVLKSIKTSYKHILSKNNNTLPYAQAIRLALKEQHQSVVSFLNNKEQ